MLIPLVGVCDSNADPNMVTYPIPGNDDTPKAVNFYLSLMKRAIMAGKNLRRQQLVGFEQGDNEKHVNKRKEEMKQAGEQAERREMKRGARSSDNRRPAQNQAR